METKLAAVRIANEANRPAVIANGRTPGVLGMICAGEPAGTLFLASEREDEKSGQGDARGENS
jgi:glutamate 5-kinase